MRKQHLKIKKLKWGFTLIELLVVMAILGIIVTMATIGLTKVRIKARDDKRVSDIGQLQKALEMYRNDNDVYPGSIVAGQPLVGPNGITYMKKIPAAPNSLDGDCPADSYVYTSLSSASYSITYCLGSAVSDVSAGLCTAVPGNIRYASPAPPAPTAYDTGWVYPSTLADVDLMSSPWYDTANAATTNSSYTYNSAGGITDTSCDYRVRIVKGGSISTTERKDTASPASLWGAAPDQTITYGSGSTDLWGETLSYADVTASTFGFVMSVDSWCDASTFYSDYLKATNFNFSSIPDTATITGVQAQVVRHNGSSSFLAGTKISTPTGLKNIEDIVAGDDVLAFDTAQENIVTAKVLATVNRESDYMELATANRQVEVTATHPFYVGGGKFIASGDLQIGDWVYVYNGIYPYQEQITAIKKITNKTRVYNFEVETYHDYVANGFVVHNLVGASYGWVDSMALKVYYTN